MLYPSYKDLLLCENSLPPSGKEIKNFKASGLHQDDYLSGFKGHGLTFRELREYNYGDDIRNIEWRHSAKSQDEIFLKTFEEERQRNILLVVDCNSYMAFGTRKTFKNIVAAKVTAMLGFYCLKKRENVGLYLFGNFAQKFKYSKISSLRKNFLQGLRGLCNEPTREENYDLDSALFNLRRMHLKHNIIFIISDFRKVSEYLEKNIYMLGQKSEVVLVHVVDDADFNIPQMGNITFEFGSFKYIFNSNDKNAAKNYHQNYELRVNKLQKIAKEQNIKIISINTKDDIAATISKQLQRK